MSENAFYLQYGGLTGRLGENVLQEVLPLFEDTLTLDVFLSNIVAVTKELVPCERCTLHIVDGVR